MNLNKRLIFQIFSCITDIIAIALFTLPFISLKIGTTTICNYSGFDIAFDFNSALFRGISSKTYIGFICAFLPLFVFVCRIMGTALNPLFTKANKNTNTKSFQVKIGDNLYFTIITDFIICSIILLSKCLLGIFKVDNYQLGSGAIVVIFLTILSSIFHAYAKYFSIDECEPLNNNDKSTNEFPN